MANSKKYEVNKDNLDTFLKEFEDVVYPAIVEAGGVERLEKIVEKRREQVAANKKKRDEVASKREKEGN